VVRFYNFVKSGQLIVLEHELFRVENCPGNWLAKMLDVCSGLDALAAMPDGGIAGLTCRHQWGGVDWSSFTIRKSKGTGKQTEWAKRHRDIANDDLMPTWTIQSYFATDQETMLSVGAAKTKDIYRYADSLPRLTIRDSCDAAFVVLDWQQMQEAGVEVIVRRP